MTTQKQTQENPALAGTLGPFPMETPPVAPGCFAVTLDDPEAVEFWFWTGRFWTDSDDGLGLPYETQHASGWYGRLRDPRRKNAWALGVRIRTLDGLQAGTLVGTFYTTGGRQRLVMEFDSPGGGALRIFRPGEVIPVDPEDER
jgi:hypothetical protein